MTYQNILRCPTDIILTINVAFKIADANNLRTVIALTSLFTNVASIRIGNANVSTTAGIPLYPDSSLVLEVQGELWAITDVAGQTLSVLESINSP